MRARLRKGSFLIYALGIFILLAIFSTGLALRARVTIKQAKLYINSRRAFYLAQSGVILAKKIIELDDKTADYLGEDWAKSINETVDFYDPHQEGKLAVVVEDESSKVNINSGEPAVKILAALMLARNVYHAEDKADNILIYSGVKPLPQSDEAGFKGKRFSVPEELLSVPGISGEDYASLKDLVTIYGFGKFNVNTMPREIFDAVVSDGSVKAEMLSSLALGAHYGGTGGEILPLVPTRILVSLGTVTSHFRVTSTAAAGGAQKKITCVIERDSGRIVYWHE